MLPSPRGTSAFGTPEFVYSASAGGPYTSEQPVHAGTYYMKAMVPGTTSYGALESGPVVFNIGKAKITISADDQYSAQGEQRKELTYTQIGTALPGDTITADLSTAAAASSAAGDYPITVQVQASSDYEIEALSGVYGADWKDMTIGSTAVQLAEVSDSSFVAYWTKDGVCFSVGAENVNRWDFLRQVRDNLIDLTEHYY